ncbi:hypothetical protein [Phaeobacter sp. J2-8]|uniref:hypothetical protein n=1 Tax=Phaeobacter sp. J2-8 TaxID=2931394 RepID=UPI001FD14253|nr:hypothetical protein [Phaeobacter sp. J2-8]MCJ7872109.1 hypothetical protein [Phaeobacter sp. J2-8]
MYEAKMLYEAVLNAMRSLRTVLDAYSDVMAEAGLTAEDEDQLNWLASVALSRELFDSASLRKVRETKAYVESRVGDESRTEFLVDFDCQSGGYDRSRSTPLGQVLDGFCVALAQLEMRLVEVRCQLDAGQVSRQLSI